MQTLNLFRHFAFLIITCCGCCCSSLITTLPTVNISTADEIHLKIIFNNKSVLTHERVELVCEVKPETTVLATLWTKENEIISENRRIAFEKHNLIINRTMESDAGYYTCSVRTSLGIHNKTAFLNVTRTEEEEEDESQEKDGDGDYSGGGQDPCGIPRKELISGCDRSSDFSSCKSFIPPVDVNDIEIIPTLNKTSKYQTLTMKVQWKVPKTDNLNIWGWQLEIAAQSIPNSHKCIQINKKFIRESDNGDLYVNYSFNDIQLAYKFKIQISSLPTVGMKGGVKKEISLKDYCHVFPELPCCYVAKKIVVEQTNATSAILSWPDLTKSNIDSKLVSGFVVKYYSKNLKKSCHQGFLETTLKDAQNQAHILVHGLRLRCQNYTFQVTAVFNNYGCGECAGICYPSSKRGISSGLYFLQMTNIPEKSALHQSTKLSNLLTIVVAVFAALALIIFSTVVIIVWKRRHGVKKTKKPISESLTLKEKPVPEVFIAHGSHCKDCDDTVLSLATYLDKTGLCKCIPNLYSLPKEWSPSKTQYYENQIEKCQKVIVLFTTNENHEFEDSIKERNFMYQKNLIRSELLIHYATTKFIPVYMDFLSNLDIPSFLRNKKSFSLPSQLEELAQYIIEEPVRKPVSASSNESLEENVILKKRKKILEGKIKDLNIKHLKKLRVKDNDLVVTVV